MLAEQLRDDKKLFVEEEKSRWKKVAEKCPGRLYSPDIRIAPVCGLVADRGGKRRLCEYDRCFALYVARSFTYF